MLACGLLAAMLLAGAACGPVIYVYTVTNKASRALAEAKADDAERLAPYEYWTAVTYLHMAREKAGEADWEIANDYGDRAFKNSKAASEVARRRARTGEPPIIGGAARDVSPAKGGAKTVQPAADR